MRAPAGRWAWPGEWGDTGGRGCVGVPVLGKCLGGVGAGGWSVGGREGGAGLFRPGT
jgi:hypothetical protein